MIVAIFIFNVAAILIAIIALRIGYTWGYINAMTDYLKEEEADLKRRFDL